MIGNREECDICSIVNVCLSSKMNDLRGVLHEF